MDERREGRGSFAAIDAVTILYSLGRQNQMHCLRDYVYVSSLVRGGVIEPQPHINSRTEPG